MPSHHFDMQADRWEQAAAVSAKYKWIFVIMFVLYTNATRLCVACTGHTSPNAYASRVKIAFCFVFIFSFSLRFFSVFFLLFCTFLILNFYKHLHVLQNLCEINRVFGWCQLSLCLQSNEEGYCKIDGYVYWMRNSTLTFSWIFQ